MTDPDRGDTAAPRRGRPRSEKARKAILHAAAELLLDQGLGAVSMDDSRRAGRASARPPSTAGGRPRRPSRSTRWRTSGRSAPADPPDTGTLRDDLLALLRPWARLVTTRPYARVIAGTGHQGADRPRRSPSEYVANTSSTPPRPRPHRPFTRAIDRGEIARRRTTSTSRSTCSTARSTTGCCTATHRSTTRSSRTSSTSRCTASSPPAGSDGTHPAVRPTTRTPTSAYQYRQGIDNHDH